MSTAPEIPKAYDPQEWEDKIYKQWEDSGYFNPDVLVKDDIVAPDAPTFSMVLPPPNVTGHLHVGHSTMLALEDIMTRFHRMRGFRTLWLPGTDHAAIATQSKVEKLIMEKEGKTRHDFSREEFLNRVEAFAQASHDTIVKQTKKMGSSLDWSREAYTLDEQRNLAVRIAFKKMYDDGIIYRGHRIVNWDPKLQTTVSDDEIEWKEEKIPFYYIQYGPFVIATARPETKFGDKYVVMHPEDKRYAEYAHGQKIELEWINGPITATVIKDTVIDQEFGTGVMTITPWHDHTDFDIAERHNLDKEPIISEDGKLLAIAGEFAEMSITEAREKIIEKLTKKGLLVKTEENYIHNVATNSRGGGVIEPQIKQQWFIGVNREFERDGKKITLKALMQHAVRSGDIRIIPERFEKTYFHWIDNLRDWCISRQIWYGHRIPVWYRDKETHCGIEAPKEEGWEQDSDTLDTWFSSGLWTFSTLGWPDENTSDLKTYHPTSVLETGYDILFFWVARMILMSEYFLNEIPFRNVYLHGLVRDEQGRKMSKSLGNVLDPLDIIPTYGADALRLTLILGSTPGNDIKIGSEKISSSRNFTNKLWNIGRYVLTQSKFSTFNFQLSTSSPADRWILSRLETTIGAVTQHLKQYNFSLAGETLRDFTWNDFADWYVEVHKIEKNDAVLRYVFETLLKLWHPFMPFVTEALWQTAHVNNGKFLMVEQWPEKLLLSGSGGEQQYFETVITLITQIRAIRSSYRIEPAQHLDLIIITTQPDRVQSQEAIIKRLARIGNISISSETTTAPKGSVSLILPDLQAFLLLEGIVDFAAEHARITKEKLSLEAYATRTTERLANPQFTAKAPAQLIEQTKEQLATTQNTIRSLEEELERLKQLI